MWCLGINAPPLTHKQSRCDMEFSKVLREIRANRNAEIHFQRILAFLKSNPARRLQVLALLAKSRTEWRRERAAHLAEMAGGILYSTFGKPKLAEVVYRYALTISEDPLPSLFAIFEIAESQNRYLVAYEIAERIFELASPGQSDDIRYRLQKMAFSDRNDSGKTTSIGI